jgi:hypothetical protein
MMRFSRERKTLTIHPRRCRSETFLQESYRKTPNRALRQVIYFVGVRRIGEPQPLEKPKAPQGNTQTELRFTFVLEHDAWRLTAVQYE